VWVERQLSRALLGSVLLLVTLASSAHAWEAAPLRSPESPQPNGDISSAIGTSELLDHWRSNEMAPLEYLAAKFRHERWIVLGEFHRVRHDVQLIASLVPRLHETTDVRHLALEFKPTVSSAPKHTTVSG
jgi:hypothetical protein